MAAGSVDLEIVTPEGIALAVTVDELTAPSVDGEFGVLPGHRPLLAALDTGIVSYKKEGKEVRVAVGSGFIEVSHDKAILLTQHFSTKDAIDPVNTRLELRDADKALDDFKGEPGSPEHHELVLSELWAAARLELYGDPPPPRVRTEYAFAAPPPDAYAPGAEASAAATPAKD